MFQWDIRRAYDQNNLHIRIHNAYAVHCSYTIIFVAITFLTNISCVLYRLLCVVGAVAAAVVVKLKSTATNKNDPWEMRLLNVFHVTINHI